MAEFEAARLLTILGARFDPEGFDQFDRAMGGAEAQVRELRRELARDYPTAALKKYALDIDQLRLKLAKLHEAGPGVRAVTTRAGQQRFQGAGGKFVSAEAATKAEAAYARAVADTEVKILGLQKAMERVSRESQNLAMTEERSAARIVKAEDSIALGLAKLEVAAGKASFNLKDFSAAEVSSLERVAMSFERTSIQADAMRAKVGTGLARITAEEEKLAAQAKVATRSIADMTAAERRSAVEAIHAAHGHAEWAHRLREIAGIVAVTFGAEQVYEQILKTQEAANLFQEAQARLQVSMRNAGIGWEDYEKRIEETTHALREQSGFTDFEIQDSLANAIRATGRAGSAAERYAKAWRIVQTSLDLARTKHIGLQAATTLTAQATSGYARGLARLGITVTGSTEHADKLRGVISRQRGEFSKWLTDYRRWVGDQVAVLHYRRADALAIHNFIDQTNKVIQKRREELGATANQEKAQLKAAQAADKAQTGVRLLAALSATFAGQATAYGHTLSGAWARFKAQIDATRESTSRELLPALTKVVEYLSTNFVARVGTEIDRLNDLWLDMAHSIRDIATAFLPLLEGASVAALGAIKGFFAVLAPTLHMAAELINTIGGANIGVFVASWWAASRALTVFLRVGTSVRTLLIAAAFRDAFVAFRSAPGLIAGATSSLRAFGAGIGVLLPEIGVGGALALGVAAVAAGIYYMSTRESELDRVNRQLSSSIRDLGSAFKEEMDAVDRLNDAHLTVLQQKQALKATDQALTLSEHQYTTDVKKLSADRAAAAKNEAELRSRGASKAAIDHYKSVVATQIQDDKNRIKRDRDRLDELRLQRRSDVLRLHQAKDFETTATKQRRDAYRRTVHEEQAFRKDIMRVSDPRLYGDYLLAPKGPARERAREQAAVKAVREELTQLRRAEHGYYKDASGHTVQLSGSFRAAARSVLSIYTALHKLPSRQIVNLILQHGDLAPAIARMSKELGKPLNLAQVRFFVDHPKLRAQILAAIQKTGQWPRGHELQPTIKIPPKSSFIGMAKRLSEQIGLLLHPKLNANYDPSQVDHMTANMRKRATAAWRRQMQSNPFLIHFQPDQQSQDLYRLLTGKGSMTVTWSSPGAQGGAGGTATGTVTAPAGGQTQPAAGGAGSWNIPPPPTTRKTGGPITRPTFTLMGEEAPRFPEYVFSTNPRDRRHNTAAFLELAQLYGLSVEKRQTGTAPGGTDPIVQQALDAAKRSELGHKPPKKPGAGRKPVDIFTDEINALSEQYQEAYNLLDLAAARTERTRNVNDDFRVNQAIARLERFRLRTIQQELRDPRFRTFRTSGTTQDRNTAQQAYNQLITEEATLYRDITTRQQGPTVDLTKLLSPREQYQLDEAARRGDVGAQRRILSRELRSLDRMRRHAVGKRQWSLADQISQQEATIKSQLEGLTGDQQAAGQDYLQGLQTEAQALLGPSAYFTREAAGGAFGARYRRPGAQLTTIQGTGGSLASMAAGASHAPAQVVVQTLHPADSRTLRAISQATSAAYDRTRSRPPTRRSLLL